MISEALLMISLNRRKFVQVACSSLLFKGIYASGSPLPAGAQRFLLSMGQAERNNPFHSVVQRLDGMTGVLITGWKTHADNLPHPEAVDLDDSNWGNAQPVQNRFGGAAERSSGGGAAWFRKLVKIPKSLGGYNIQGLPVRLNLRIFSRTRGAIRVFSNGSLVEMAQGNVQQPILLTDSAQSDQKFLIAAYSPGPGVIFARLEVDYPPGKSNPATMLEEILCVQAMSRGFPEGRSQRDAQLNAAVKAIHFDALDHGDQEAFNQSLTEADGKMQPLVEWIRQFTICAVGNSHIDMAWLWPWTETVEVVRNTFGTVLELMDEYPGFLYAQSTAQDFLWLEEKYPDMFKEIQNRVKEGRWELVGGMWVEPDLNMPCGESLVRQLLTGKRYFQQEFGVDVRIGWNPDSFGYSWQLAQIYKRSGVDYFVTQKISWNDTTQFPYKLFWWESPDGSRVLTYFPHGYGNGINPVQCSGFIAEETPLCSGFREQMLLYGVGDHGGGPTRQMLDTAVRWLKSPKAAFPNFKFSTAQEFFNEVEAHLPSLNLPVWKNELYLQYHRGTYTTQAETKKRMRRTEELLLNSEKFASLAMLDGRPYPQHQFLECWRRTCFDQFHDLMAGSGIHINYIDEAKNLEFVKFACSTILSGALETLVARINTQGAGRPVVVFNPLSWERTEVVEVEVQFPAPISQIEVRDPEDRVLPSAVISRDDSTHSVKVRFLARSLPPMGYKVFHLVSVKTARVPASTLKTNGLKLENEFISLEIDPKTGLVSNLFNKKDGRNILKPGRYGNLLETFVDKPKQYDAWNIGWPYESSKVELMEAQQVKLVENTAVRAVIRVRKKFQNSSFVQDICVYPEVPRVDVRMQADWHEQHVMLKVAFPVDVQTESATYEIPYGTIERPAIPRVPGKPPVPFTEAQGVSQGAQKYDPLKAQEAEWEVPAQRWGDLSDSRRGFSLLNDCKYGYDTVEPMVIRLTLLRSPVSPDPVADQGRHDFTYAMYPHVGGWREGDTERRGYELNYRPLVLAVETHQGSLPPSYSFVEIEPRNLILTAIKKAEDDNALIFRFFEFEGKPAQARLRLPRTATKAIETNLMEKEENALSLSAGKEVLAEVRPYEIKSVKVFFENSAGAAPPPFTV
jgi:alpha-mannosidase